MNERESSRNEFIESWLCESPACPDLAMGEVERLRYPEPSKLSGPVPRSPLDRFKALNLERLRRFSGIPALCVHRGTERNATGKTSQ